VVGWIGNCGHGIAVAAPRLGERFLKLPHLALQPTAFEPLVPQRALRRLHTPVQPHHSVGRGTDGEQDDAGDLDGAVYCVTVIALPKLLDLSALFWVSGTGQLCAVAIAVKAASTPRGSIQPLDPRRMLYYALWWSLPWKRRGV
jgi:hypothetical protein